MPVWAGHLSLSVSALLALVTKVLYASPGPQALEQFRERVRLGMERQEAASRSASSSPEPKLLESQNCSAAGAEQHGASSSAPVSERGNPDGGGAAPAGALGSGAAHQGESSQLAAGAGSAAAEGTSRRSQPAGPTQRESGQPEEGLRDGSHRENGALHDGAHAQPRQRLQQGGEGLYVEEGVWEAEREAFLKGKLLRELWGLCKDYGLPRHGRKEAVVQRLVQHERACQAPVVL